MSHVIGNSDAPLDAGLEALKDRKTVLDAIWLATLLLVLVGLAVPWYFGILDVNLGPVSWLLFGYALVHLAAMSGSARLHSRRQLLAATTALQSAGVLMLGLVWYLLGGVQAPMFLLAFVVPVVASGILGVRWQPYALAALAILSVWSVAALTSLSMRWYLVQLGVPLSGWLATLSLPAVQGPFPALAVEPAYVIVLIEHFAVLLMAVVLATESLTTTILRLSARLDTSGDALREAEGLACGIIRSSRHPAVLVDRSTQRVVEASESFVQQFLLQPSQLADRTILALLDLPFPEPLQTALSQGGEVSFAPYRVGSETRVARISVYLLDHGGVGYAHVSLHDVSDLYYLQGTLHVVDSPYLLVGTDRRILYFNQAAESLFGPFYAGIPASDKLELESLPPGWWDPAPRRSHRRQLQIRGITYRADLVVGDLPGHTGPLTVIALHRAELPS